MASIEVTDRAQVLVITSREGRAGVLNAGSFYQEVIQLEAKLNECLGLVGLRRSQKISAG